MISRVSFQLGLRASASYRVSTSCCPACTCDGGWSSSDEVSKTRRFTKFGSIQETLRRLALAASSRKLESRTIGSSPIRVPKLISFLSNQAKLSRSRFGNDRYLPSTARSVAGSCEYQRQSPSLSCRVKAGTS